MKMKYISWLSILSVLALSGCEDGMERAAEIGDSVCVLASRAGADASVWEDDTSMKVRNYTVTDDNGEQERMCSLSVVAAGHQVSRGNMKGCWSGTGTPR